MAAPSTIPRYPIVVALDASQYAEITLEHALDQAARHQDPDLHVLTVVSASADIDAAKRALTARVLPTLREFARPSWHVHFHVRTGVPHEEISGLAGELRAKLVVVGRFGLHHEGATKRSIANQVVEAVTCPTLVVGLEDDSPDRSPTCQACAQIRRETEGRQLFCPEHSGDDRVRSTVFVPETAWAGGTLMW